MGLFDWIGSGANAVLGTHFGQQDPYFQTDQQANGLQEGMADALANSANHADPSIGVSGSAQAAQQVQSNPLLTNLFPQLQQAQANSLADRGSLQGQMASGQQQQQDLLNNGFKLNSTDQDAYGQASGNIARMYGGQEQGLSQSLADRGFGGSPNNIAGAQFTGLQGNKNEQLAQAQTQIAQQRMQNATQRLANTQDYMSKIGALQNQNTAQYGSQAGAQGQLLGGLQQQQYERQLQGAQQSQAAKQAAFGAANQMYNSRNQGGLASMQSMQGAKNGTLGDAFQAGSMSSMTSIANGPGKLSDSFLGSVGQAGGSAMGAMI